MNAGFGNAPNGKQWGISAGEGVNVVNNLNDHEQNNTPGCTNPTNFAKMTAFVDSAPSISLVGRKALCKIAEVQDRNKTLGIPNGATMETTQ